jgi:hypothetical protein
MRLATEFIRLPFNFDAERLTQEVLAFDDSEWMPHPQGHKGNMALPLISLNGEMNDGCNGPMQATEKLERAPYMKQVLASFDEVFGRSRLMGLAAKCAVPQHFDAIYHWHNRVRIHIPIITDPQVLFYCGDTHVHMAAGETWIFDSWRKHRVENASDRNRVHLVIDTAGSKNFWELVDSSEWRREEGCIKPATVEDQSLPFEEDKEVRILTEQYNAPLVMHPGEVDALTMDIVSDMRAHQENPASAMKAFEKAVHDFRLDWRRLWYLYGPSREGWAHFEALIRSVQLPAEHLRMASNGGPATYAFQARILTAALNVSLADEYPSG